LTKLAIEGSGFAVAFATCGKRNLIEGDLEWFNGQIYELQQGIGLYLEGTPLIWNYLH